MIPPVVASEKGRAQTDLRVGVVGPQQVNLEASRMTLKGQSKKVQTL